jgi:hypothetical protein
LIGPSPSPSTEDTSPSRRQAATAAAELNFIIVVYQIPNGFLEIVSFMKSFFVPLVEVRSTDGTVGDYAFAIM